ncbi:MAG: glycoside hydrolase family 13 protein [Clostridiales bacterium]|jgi:glycosidase|nr:glycoside hydrolase family 13 protein [Clostridiales bacterium]
MFLFHSRKQEYKSIFGAVRVGQTLCFRFPFDHTGEVFGVSLILKKYTGEVVNVPMKFESEKDGLFTYFSELALSEAGIYFYGFEVYTDGGTAYVKRGKGGCAEEGKTLPDWQLTVYEGTDERPALSGGVIYHIFADRFCKGDYTPREEKHGIVKKAWNELPTVVDHDGVFRANDFFGGNAQGIIDKLDYIASLGVNVLYLSPIFEAASNHRYDTGDYFKIDPLFGDEALLKELIAECEKRGMIVMMDGVFNHTGSDSRYFNRHGHYDSVGAYQSKASPYYDWYTFRHFPNKYDCWWGIEVVPTLKKDNPDVRRLVRDVLVKWLNMGVKGVRLDVADELPSDYIYDIHTTVKSIHPDGYLLGEVWEDASTKVSYGSMRPYLLGSQLDSVMNYPFKEGILRYAMCNDIEFLKETVMSILENYPKNAVRLLMNIIDTHDTVRAVNYFLKHDYSHLSKKQKRELVIPQEELENALTRLKLAVLIEFTLPGIPSVYYGDEVGLTGFEDPLNRAPYPYGRENLVILDFYKTLGAFRKEFKEDLDDIRFIGAEGLLCYALAADKAAVVINNGEKTRSFIAEKACRDYLSGRAFKENEEIRVGRGEYFLLVSE